MKYLQENGWNHNRLKYSKNICSSYIHGWFLISNCNHSNFLIYQTRDVVWLSICQLYKVVWRMNNSPYDRQQWAQLIPHSLNNYLRTHFKESKSDQLWPTKGKVCTHKLFIKTWKEKTLKLQFFQIYFYLLDI